MPCFLLCLPLVNFTLVCYPKVLRLKKKLSLTLNNPVSLFCLQILMFCLPRGPLLVRFSTECFICPTVFYIFLIILVWVFSSISASLLNSNFIVWIGFFISHSSFCSSGKIYPSELCICNFTEVIFSGWWYGGTGNFWRSHAALGRHVTSVFAGVSPSGVILFIQIVVVVVVGSEAILLRLPLFFQAEGYAELRSD